MTRALFSGSQSRTLLAVLLGSVLPTFAASSPASAAASTNLAASKSGTTNTDRSRADAVPVFAPIPQSVFVVPKTRTEGVDPFFPLSKRLEVSTAINPTNPPAVVGELMVKGFSGSAASPLVIINNRTFGVGDVGDVSTPQGRVRVRCLEIQAKGEYVIVEANNERRELRFRSGK